MPGIEETTKQEENIVMPGLEEEQEENIIMPGLEEKAEELGMKETIESGSKDYRMNVQFLLEANASEKCALESQVQELQKQE